MFRRAIGMEIWHSTPACPFWPITNYEEKETPTIGVRCANCHRLDMANQHVRADAPKDK